MLKIINKGFSSTNYATEGGLEGEENNFKCQPLYILDKMTHVQDTPYTQIKRDLVQYAGLELCTQDI